MLTKASNRRPMKIYSMEMQHLFQRTSRQESSYLPTKDHGNITMPMGIIFLNFLHWKIQLMEPAFSICPMKTKN